MHVDVSTTAIVVLIETVCNSIWCIALQPKDAKDKKKKKKEYVDPEAVCDERVVVHSYPPIVVSLTPHADVVRVGMCSTCLVFEVNTR
jgi:hypothetical protein